MLAVKLHYFSTFSMLKCWHVAQNLLGNDVMVVLKTSSTCLCLWKWWEKNSSTTHQIHHIHKALGLSNYGVLDEDVFFLVTGKWFILLLHIQGADCFSIRRRRCGQRHSVILRLIVWCSVRRVAQCRCVANLESSEKKKNTKNEIMADEVEEIFSFYNHKKFF